MSDKPETCDQCGTDEPVAGMLFLCGKCCGHFCGDCMGGDFCANCEDEESRTEVDA